MFPIRLLGYDRSEVEGELMRLQEQIQELKAALGEAKTAVNELQMQLEESSILLAAARRDRLLVLQETTSHQIPVTLIFGPVRTFASLVPLVDDLEELPDLTVKFRIYRDGVYRVDAMIDATEQLEKWLKRNPSVRDVFFEDSSFQVLLKE